MGGIGKILAIILGVVVIGGVGGYFALPSTASKTQTFTIERPANVVYGYLASAPAGTKIAEGITEKSIKSASGNTVVAEIAFADGTPGTATYTVTPNGAKSDVSLKIEQPLGANPLDRVKGLTGGAVAPLVEAASAQATADLNGLPAADPKGLAYEIVTVPAQPFLYVPWQVSQEPDNITEAVSQSLEIVDRLLSKYNLRAVGQPMAVETSWAEGNYGFQVGVPYEGSKPKVTVGAAAGTTPNGSAIKVHYTGDEKDVIPVYDQMEALIAAARLQRGLSFEVYFDDPTKAGGSHNRDIYYLVTGDTAALTRILPASAAPAPGPANLAPPAVDPATTPAAPAPAAPAAPAPAAPVVPAPAP